jgi:mono/diheme cytochrome c family protein
MKKLLLALVLLPLGQSAALAQNAPTGDVAAGKALWDNELRCKDCHGGVAEGAFGPDLAGRGLNYAQVRRAVRQPWGIMPRFIDEQVSDQELANLAAYFASMPKVAQPGPWKTEVPANAPAGQRTMITIGCGQCHGNVLIGPRDDMGAVNADIAWLKDLVYNHTTAIRTHQQKLGVGNGPPRVHMGNFNPDRVTEAQLATVLDWIKSDVGFRAAMRGRISKGQQSEKGVTYTLNVQNLGLPGKGLGVEGVTVSLVIPEGANVVAATGEGYKGVHMDAKQKAQVAEWAWPKAGPQDKVSYSITLSKAGTEKDNLRGLIHWEKPMIKPGPTGDEIAIPGAPL